MSIKTGSPPPKDKYQLLKEEYDRTQDVLKSSDAIIDEYDSELSKIKGELRKAYKCIGHLQHQISKIHEEKVIGAQVETISISEVCEKVTALNYEIFQAADTLGEALIHERRALSLADLDAAAAVSQEMVGEKMTNILITQSQNQESEINPVLLQVVLRIFMVKFCVSKIQSWYPDSDNSAAGEILSTIYSEIRSTEEQEVSGRWRALTRAHTRPSTETWEKELYQKLQSVLMMASWGVRSPEFFGYCLPSIFKAINDFRMVIGEKFTSADLDTIVFACDRIYNPAKMDDAYHDSDGRQSSASGKRARETIVGTTGIGLGKVVAETKDVLQIRSLIPAEIVLWSTINKALGPMEKKPVEITDGANQDGRD